MAIFKFSIKFAAILALKLCKKNFFSHFYDHFNLSQPFLCGVFFLVSQNLCILVMAIFKFSIKFAAILALKLCKKKFFSHFYDHFNFAQRFLCGVIFFWCPKIFFFGVTNFFEFLRGSKPYRFPPITFNTGDIWQRGMCCSNWWLTNPPPGQGHPLSQVIVPGGGWYTSDLNNTLKTVKKGSPRYRPQITNGER